MFQPLFNTVVVEIDDADALYGSGNDDAMLGKSYRDGTVIEVGDLIPTQEYPANQATLDLVNQLLATLVDQPVRFNEGVEAGTTWEENNKTYALIYWWDLRAVKKEYKPLA